MTTKQVLVTGATGTLGRALLPRLAAAGHEVRALSRRPRATPELSTVRWLVGDLRRGTGLADAVAGVDTVVHCATSPIGDTDAAQHLLAALRDADRRAAHLVYISIVGIDRIPLGYYRTKLATETLIAAAGQAHTILRATQFHDLILRLFTAQRWLPILLVPRGFRFQPVDVADVAARLARCVDDGPANRVPDLGGPDVAPVEELASSYLRMNGRRRPIVPVGVPGKIGRGFRTGANLCPAQRASGRTFEGFLADTLGPRA